MLAWLLKLLLPTDSAQGQASDSTPRPRSNQALLAENESLRARLAQAEESLLAARTLPGPGAEGFNVSGASRPSRLESQRLQPALLESDDALGRLAEAMPQIVWATSADGANTYCNPLWCDYTGLTQQGSRGDGWIAAFHPDDRQHAWLAWQRAMQQLEPYEVEARLRRDDGVYRWWLIRGAPSRYALGEVRQWFGTCTDIEDLKQAQTSLRETQERLQLATEAAGLGVWSWQPDGDIAVWENTKIAEIMGIRPTDPPINQTRFVNEFLHPDDLAAFEHAIARTMQAGEPLQVTGRIRLPDGTLRWVDVTGRAMAATPGKSDRVIGTMRDVTELRQADAALKRRHAHTRFVSSIASRLVLRDPRGRPVSADALLASSFGTLARHLGVEFYFNYAVAQEPDTLRLVSSAGIGGAARASVSRIGFGDYLCGVVAETRRPLVIDDVPASTLPNSAGLSAMGVQIYAGYPLLAGERLIGTIAFASARKQPFVAGELELIQLVADLLAAAVERDRLTDRVRTSEARFRKVFQYAGTGITMADLQGLIQTANPAFCQLLGYTAEELRKKQVSSLVHPEDRKRNEAELRRVLQQDSPTSEIENRYVRKDSSVVWVHKVLSVLRDESGIAHSVLALVTDVTQRKLAETAVHASEARFRAVADSIPQLAWMADRNGAIGWFNQGWLDYTGTTLADNLGGGWKAVHDPKHVDAVLEKFERALREGLDWEDTFPLRGKDGRFRWFLSRMNAIRDDTGQVVRFFGTNTDITERRRSEEALQQSEEMFRGFFDNAAVGAAQLDAAGRFIRVNERYCAITGYGCDELLASMRAQDLDHPEDQPVDREGLIAMGRGELAFYESEKRFARKDGSAVWTHVSAAPVRAVDGHVRFIAVVVEDITARRLAEQALREADRRKDDFLATLAHELRNPLAPVRSAVHVLQRLEPATPELRWVGDVIDRQMAHLSRLIDDLMNVSRINLGKIELHRQPVALADVLRAAVETSRPLIDAMEHQLDLALPPAGLIIDADATRLTQVFQNLLNNAAKYTTRGGRIALRVESGVGQVAVRVTDSGIGIAADQLPIIFDMFSQVEDALARSQGGLGIGLFLVRRLVDMHGGCVLASSAGLGRGSEFVVVLPVAGQTLAIAPLVSTLSALPTLSPRIIGAPGAPSPSDSNPNSSPAAIAMPALRILVVDDNRDAADSAAMLLEMMGHEVRTAYDGEAGVQAAAEFCPQVALLDIGMPKMNGYEAARAIRQQPGGDRVRLVAVTGWGQDDDRLKSAAAGFDRHLVKPVNPPDLIALLQEWVKAS